MRNIILLCFLLTISFCTAPETGESAGQTTATDQLAAFVAQFNPSAGRGGSFADDDFSQSSFAAALDKTKKQLAELRAIDTTQLSFDDRIDWKFAQSILVGRELEQENMQFWKKDPRTYMSFRGLGNVMGSPGEVKEKIDELEKRLLLVPTQLKNGQEQLEVYVPRFQELSRFMAENGRVLFTEELKAFIEQNSPAADKLKEPAKVAMASLEAFIVFLKEELPNLPPGDFAIGEETYNRMLKGPFLLDHHAESLWNYGWEQFEATVAELEAVAKTIDPQKTWQELIREIKNEYPEPDQMIEAHQEWVDKSRAHILAKGLIPIPWKEQVKVVPRAEYLRKTSYYGNFSRARGLDSDSIYTAQWMINPFEDRWDEATKQQYLVEHDWGVIIVTAPHESYGGHHVQGLYQLQNPRPIRRDNGISIFSEGWGLYNEQLMQETGFFPNERIHLRQLQLRLWRNARVVYDVGMHSGRMTYEEAIRLMEERVGFLRWAAQLEIDSATASPGYFIGYFMGMSEILRLRTAYKAKMGEAFNLSDFHERLLKIGNMPTALMWEALMNS